MTKKSNLLVLSLLLTLAAFSYLTYHHFSVKTGLGGDSLCSISSKFNCDAAAASQFSELGGIPVAVLGGVFHLMILGFVLFAGPNLYRQRLVRAMLGFSLLTSVVMAIISATVVKVICPFCLVTYVLSVINLLLGWSLVKADNEKEGFQLSAFWGEYRSYLIALLAVPALAWLISAMLHSTYGLDKFERYIPEKLAIWKNGSEFNFDKTLGLTNGVQNPRHTIVEFADYKCPHCKSAAKTFDVFLSGKTDIAFIFKPYPLDGTCNPALPQKGDNSRCVLAAFTLCAEKLSKKGWEMHHWIFAKQEHIIAETDAKRLLPQIEKELGLEAAKMSECADSNEIYELVKRSSEEGTAAKVEGTPTVYVNGKKLPWGQMLEVLKQAVK